MKAIILSAAAKGGILKSTLAGVMYELSKISQNRTTLIDCDSSNSTSSTIYREAEFIDLRAPKVAGSLARLAEREADIVVVDVGARDEEIIRHHFPVLREVAAGVGARIVCLRAINLSIEVHTQIREWLDHYCDPGTEGLSKALLFRSLACGRTADDFAARWNSYKWVQRAIDDGRAVQVDLEDMGAVYAENLPFVQTPLGDIVSGNFRGATAEMTAEARERYLERCRAIYDADARAHLGLWMRDARRRTLAALKTLGVEL